LSFNGLEGVQPVVALNGGSHVAPCFAGDTVTAWSEVLDKAEVDVPGAGAIRLRLVAAKVGTAPGPDRDAEGRDRDANMPDHDNWGFCPR
jgi:2-methylfumaryl-CoA hydratase